MVDSQEQLHTVGTTAVSKTAGALVIGAVVALVLLRRMNISISAS